MTTCAAYKQIGRKEYTAAATQIPRRTFGATSLRANLDEAVDQALYSEFEEAHVPRGRRAVAHAFSEQCARRIRWRYAMALYQRHPPRSISAARRDDARGDGTDRAARLR